jgi:flagellar basal-body rod protein FlgF
MERGLYIAESGMLAELTRQDQIANDLANASTPGYKPDRVSQVAFDELLLQNGATGATVGPLDLSAGIGAVTTDLTQGPLRQTDEPLDVALSGDGFLAVKTAAGTLYTRNGQLALDGQGRLTTASGDLVLDEKGQPIAVGSGTPAIAADGTVSAGGKAVGKLAIVSLTNPVKQGDNLFAGTPGTKPDGTVLRQGYLEGSGVNPARTMIDMIVSLRAFESLQRVIHGIDETLGRGIGGQS